MHRLLPVLLLASGCDDFLMLPADEDVAVAPRVVSRLNRQEYDNTVRDLFGTTMRPAESFPADDFGYGFDNIAATLSLSPLHLEQYGQAAQSLVAELYGLRTVSPEVWRVEAEEADATGGAIATGGRVLFGGDQVIARVHLSQAGEYASAAVVGSYRGRTGQVVLRVDGVDIGAFEVAEEQRIEANVTLGAGPHELSVAFLDAEGPNDVDEEMVVDVLELSGPIGLLAPPPALADDILGCAPGEQGPSGTWTESDCAEHIVATFGRRAWRRPLTRAELDAQLALYGAARGVGSSFDEAVGTTLESLLISPHFLYRIERDPVGEAGSSVPVDSYVLATRLSYFLWSSTPDDRLLDLAAAGRLQDDDVLAAEVERMLADPRAVALVDNLGGQWLGLRKVSEATPDPERFPAVDTVLTRAMEKELHALVRGVFLEDRPLPDLVTGTQTTLEPSLATHYGVDPSATELLDRPGLLARAGWLMSTSHPTRTSPVKRGAWVLDKILCAPPPPAPAGVPELEEAGGASVIEQLAQHRADPACAACHDAMDPIGIGLESFDAVGRVRTQYDDGQPVEVAGELLDGPSFSTTQELLVALGADPRFPACAAQQTFTYAMSRPPSVADQELLQVLTDTLVADGSFRSLVEGIVLSRPFRERRIEEED